jgi:hypothetical protein
VNQWTQTETLSDPLQSALDAQSQLAKDRSWLGVEQMRDLTDTFGDPMDMSQYDVEYGLWNQFQVTPQEMLTTEGLSDRQTSIDTERVDPYEMVQGVDTSGIDPLTGQTLQTSTGFMDPGLSGQTLGTDLDFSSAYDVNDPEFLSQSASDALYEQATSRLDPQFEEDQQALEVQLASQGLKPGDAAYDSAMDTFNRSKTDAYSQAALDASIYGGQEAERMFGMESDLRDQQTGETTQQAEFMNAALTGQFGIDAQLQAQQQQIAQSEADFTNAALSGQFGLDAQRQAQAFDQETTQADLANQYALGMFGQQDTAAQNFFNQQLAAGEFANIARDQQFNEDMLLQSFNRDEEYRYADQLNQLRQNAINEEMMTRAAQLNEVNALIAGQQVAQPTFQPYNTAGSAGAPALLDAAAYQGQQAAANTSAENQAISNIFGGATGLATGAMMGGYI